MPLEVDNVAIAFLGTGAQEMIEGDFVQSGCGSESRNVAANALLDLVRTDDHGQGVPAHQALDTPLHFLASRKGGLSFGRDGVLVRGSSRKGQVQTGGAPGMQSQLLEQPAGAVRTAFR